MGAPVLRRARCGSLLLALVFAWGCAPVPHRYLYQPPAPVREEDWRACYDRADGLARRRYQRYTEMVELAGPFGGPFGGIALARRAWAEREQFYAWEMKACLGERGYKP
ncbi:MAG: hypothetical protein HY002_09170 [Candidatus Rokubacteria bacterium]|nr:hypothetical protein [Candidatus Rokubacteria bacterium]